MDIINNDIGVLWDREALSDRKEEIRGNYLAGLFHRAINEALVLMPKDMRNIKLLKTDLWNEGVDSSKDVLGYFEKKQISLFGIDVSVEVLRAVHSSRIHKAQAVISHIPYKDGTFDIVADLSTIDHVPEKTIPYVLGEYKRILKPGGIAVIAFDAWGFFWRAYFSYLKHIRKIKVGVFPETDIQNQYIYQPKVIGRHMLDLGFALVKEFSIDWFGWTYNRITIPLWSYTMRHHYQQLINMEYSLFSKHMKVFAKQYVFIARRAANSEALIESQG